MRADQVWTLDHEGRHHRVETSGSARHRVRWLVDGELVAEGSAGGAKVTVKAPDEAAGRLAVRYSGLGVPRRATLYGAGDGSPLTGRAGVDLVPVPGSPAAAHERRVLDHPTRHALLATAGGVARVVVPILLSLVAVRIAIAIPWPRLPHPDLPRIPWPDVPLPDLPDLPDVHLPEWLIWVLIHVHYVWPVVLAYVVARAEITRRREQERRRAAADTAAD